jgi:hypothetical protein
MQSGTEAEAINYLLLGGHERYIKILPHHPLRALDQLNSAISKAWTPVGELGQPRLRKAKACLDRLEAFCLQVTRLAEHARSLARRPFPEKYEREARKRLGSSGFRRGMISMRVFDEACTDFESLLFHGRAALDVVTRFIASEHNQYNESFSDLRNLLTRNAPREDPRASAMLHVLDKTPEIEGVLADPPGEKSLRSKVAHYTSLQVGIRSAFTVTRLNDGGLLMFDCSALGYPAFATTRKLARDVPFVVLSAVAAYLREPILLTRAGCEPAWRIPTVVFDEFLDKTQAGPIFAVGAPTPDGFKWRREHLRPEVLRFALPSPALKRRGKKT